MIGKGPIQRQFICNDRTKTMKYIYVVIFFCLAASAVTAAPSVDPAREMNGYSLGEFKGFLENWRLVTVRYRKDSGEMRFTYANPAAWEVLSKNRTDYPDGAVFAKVGILTRPDPDFESSAVPSGARRIQFMVRDAKKHAETDGWGYALFDSQGRVFPEDKKLQSIACAACHRLVPQRGYVFSQVMNLHEQIASPALAPANLLKFGDRGPDGLPAELKKILGNHGQKKIRAVEGELTKAVFFGTLDEIRPMLALEAVKAKRPAALVAADGKQFSLVLMDEKSKDCDRQKKLFPVKSYHTTLAGGVQASSYCQDAGP